jgi:hypothetical protein
VPVAVVALVDKELTAALALGPPAALALELPAVLTLELPVELALELPEEVTLGLPFAFAAEAPAAALPIERARAELVLLQSTDTTTAGRERAIGEARRILAAVAVLPITHTVGEVYDQLAVFERHSHLATETGDIDVAMMKLVEDLCVVRGAETLSCCASTREHPRRSHSLISFVAVLFADGKSSMGPP